MALVIPAARGCQWTILYASSAQLNANISMRLVPILLLFIGWITGTTAQPIIGHPPATAPPSTIEIPIRISLVPLYLAAEQSVPHQAGNWHRWKDWHGIKTQYRAWRGPLDFRTTGDVLMVQAHVRYWIKAHRKFFRAFDFNASCGINEAPRQAIIGLLVRLRWGPDWSIQPEYRILPTRFLDRCEMTVADIDVTPLVAEEFHRQMEDKLRASLQSLEPRLSSIRRQAERAWSLLQEPVPLGKDHWLSLQPAGLALSPLHAHHGSVDMYLAVILYPRLIVGSETVLRRRPLPPLGLFYPRSSGLNLRMAVDLDFTDLSRRLSTFLAEQSFEIKGQTVGVDAINVSGNEQEIIVNMRLSGDVAGTAEIRAMVDFAPESQQLHLTNLAFVYDADDPTIALLSDIFHEDIRQALETAANQMLRTRLEQWKERLMSAFIRITPADVKLDMSSLQLHSVQLRMKKNGIRLDSFASGHATFEIR